MKGEYLTQNERFYIEKRRGEDVNQTTIGRELRCLAQPSAGNYGVTLT